MLTVELIVDAVTGTLLDALDAVGGVRSIAVDDTHITVHIDGEDGAPIRDAVEAAGGDIHSFTQRTTPRFDPGEESPVDPFDFGPAAGEP